MTASMLRSLRESVVANGHDGTSPDGIVSIGEQTFFAVLALAEKEVERREKRELFLRGLKPNPLRNA